MKILENSVFWEAMTSIGTIGAVITSLYLANRKVRLYRKLEVNNSVTYHYDQGSIILSVVIENIGNRAIVIKNCGIIRGNILDTTYNKYLKEPFKSLTLEVGKVHILDYEYNVGINFNDNDVENDQVNKVFLKQNFGVQDSRLIIFKP